VHEKLLNFAAPQPRPPIDWDAEMLYDSLFQESEAERKARRLAMENGEIAADDDDDDDDDDNNNGGGDLDESDEE
jgi:hypothetical protein